MSIFVDSGNVDETRRIIESYPFISGVTCNPELLYDEGIRITDFIPAVRSFTFKVIWAQTLVGSEQEMYEHALFLRNFLHPNAVVKIPFCREGIAALRRVPKEIDTCVTSVASAAQALLAAENGAGAVAVYVGRIEDAFGEGAGLAVAESIAHMFYTRGLKTTLLAASIRKPGWVDDLLTLPNTKVTASPEVIDELFGNPVTVSALARFKEIQELQS